MLSQPGSRRATSFASNSIKGTSPVPAMNFVRAGEGERFGEFGPVVGVLGRPREEESLLVRVKDGRDGKVGRDIGVVKGIL